jgi:hypothetical protein
MGKKKGEEWGLYRHDGLGIVVDYLGTVEKGCPVCM